MSEQEELFEDFSSMTTRSVIKKNWTVMYKGQEISGTYSYEVDDWGYFDRSCEIDDEHMENLSGEDIDEIYDYVLDVMGYGK
jgi:hypothetical protein